MSNLVAGLLGVGFTGSYIFSQTTFSMRMGVDSRVMGLTLAAFELAVFALPIDLVVFLPKFFFAGLVLWIGQVGARCLRALAFLLA